MENRETTRVVTEDEGIDIAIVGMAGRFPGAKTLTEFWDNLCNGVEAITFFSDEELLEAGVSPDDLSDPNYVKAAAILDDVRGFDPGFFCMSPREAELTDPQHRFLLECAWEAIEHAGYSAESHQGNIGVFAGASTSPYVFNVLSNQHALHSWQAHHGQQTTLGTNFFSLSTRISYKLNLRGPSLNVQTACSTALVAVHLASQSLLSYQCDMALAGGVSIKVPQREGYFYQSGGIASADGHCRPFDSQAQGTTFGSGGGMIVLKRLEDAIMAGDTIHAVIKGSAINNDGSAKVSYTAPSVEGQAAVIAQALEVAGISPETIDYIEAHGTGTPMGDPIEVAALTRAFRQHTTKKQYCSLGSIKSNIGHLDAAAGIAGLIKTVLMLKHRMLPPSLNCSQPTPVVDWAETPFCVNTKLVPWVKKETPRRAGVSAFGFGGTNAHVILEEAPAPAPESGSNRPYQLLVFSARTETALERQTEQIAQVLEQQPETALADIAFTLQTGRFPFLHRRAVVVQDQPGTSRVLDPKHTFSALSVENKDCPIVFLFPGQGAQYVRMARDLYTQEAVFKQALDTCLHLLQPAFDIDLSTVLYPPDERIEWAQELLQQTYIAQPIVFALEYALAQQWLAWGIRPRAFLGHSIGEYVAACLAGVMRLEDALAIVSLRGRLVQKLPTGLMLSVSLSSEEIQPYLHRYMVDLAAINGPRQCVVSGASAAIEQLEALLAAQQISISTRRLRTSHAFHSVLMEPAMSALEEALAHVELMEPRIPFISNVTGIWITAGEATSPRYWANQLRSTVQFSAGLQQVLSDENTIVLEVGPGSTLSNLARQHTKNSPRMILSSLRNARQQGNDLEDLLSATGKLWAAGVSIDWAGFWGDEERRRIPLPTYPFERQPYWVERSTLFNQATSPNGHIDRRRDPAHWFYIPGWQQADYRQITGNTEQSARCWLVLADRSELGEQLAGRLQAEGCQVIIVYTGSDFVQCSETTFEVNPTDRAGVEALLHHLKAHQYTPQGIVHLWSVTQVRQGNLDCKQLVQAQENGLSGLLCLLQAFWQVHPAAYLTIFVVTADLYEITGEETIRSEQAPGHALRLILGQEYPGMHCCTIDIRPPCQDALPQLCKQLATELLQPVEATNIALRGGHRWIEMFSATPQEEAPTVLRSQGVYLIVGGLGRMGLLVAGEIAREVQAHIVLLDRKSVQEDSYAAQQVEKLRDLGAEVWVAQADVTDLEATKRVFAEMRQRWGEELHGVLYAAGSAQTTRTLAEITFHELQDELTQRATGLFVLEEVFAGYEPDFCLIVSSLSCVLGGLGHLAYTASHVFMDAFVREHNQHSEKKWTSINWETWDLRSEQTDATSSGIQRQQFTMNASETLSTFRRVLRLIETPQAVISSGDLFALIRKWINPGSLRRQGVAKREQQGETERGSAPPVEGNTPYEQVEQKVMWIYKDVLGLDHIGPQDNFFALGGDSLFAVQLVARLREAFQQELSLRAFFEAPTVTGVTGLLLAPFKEALTDEAEQILREIEQLTPEEVQALLAGELLSVEGDISHG